MGDDLLFSKVIRVGAELSVLATQGNRQAAQRTQTPPQVKQEFYPRQFFQVTQELRFLIDFGGFGGPSWAEKWMPNGAGKECLKSSIKRALKFRHMMARRIGTSRTPAVLGGP